MISFKESFDLRFGDGFGFRHDSIFNEIALIIVIWYVWNNRGSQLMFCNSFPAIL